MEQPAIIDLCSGDRATVVPEQPAIDLGRVDCAVVVLEKPAIDRCSGDCAATGIDVEVLPAVVDRIDSTLDMHSPLTQAVWAKCTIVALYAVCIDCQYFSSIFQEKRANTIEPVTEPYSA